MKGRNMGGVSAPAATDVRAVGVSTLHGFARAPRINAWIYGKLRGGVRGAVLEIGCGIGNLSRLILADVARTGQTSQAVFTDAAPDALDVLRAELGRAAQAALITTWDLRAPPALHEPPGPAGLAVAGEAAGAPGPGSGADRRLRTGGAAGAPAGRADRRPPHRAGPGGAGAPPAGRRLVQGFAFKAVYSPGLWIVAPATAPAPPQKSVVRSE